MPIGIASAFLVTGFLRDPPDQTAHTGDVDWTGIALLTVGIGSLQYVLEEGNAKGWFEDGRILRLAVLAALAPGAMFWWELHPKNTHPVVNFRVLKNRALSASLFLFVALGFGQYGGVFLFPLFAQGILHFTPTETGLAMLPGGVATGVSALMCGALLNGKNPMRDPRVMIACGMVLFGIPMWIMGHLTTAVGESDVRTALLVRGFGLGLLFVPINAVAYSSIKPSEAQQASGQINLSRQLGGAFGIAVLANRVAKRAQFHRIDLIGALSPGSPLTDELMRLLTGGFLARGMDPDRAHQAALSLLNAQVQQQATLLSFNDAWMFVLVAFALVSPSILILRKPGRGVAPTADAH